MRKMSSTSKRIAIIGAGLSGMGCAKLCLEQGLRVVVFEKTHYTFGLWRYQEAIDENGIPSVMKSTVINTSKELSAISDFPPPEHFPNFMHNTLNIEYYEAAEKHVEQVGGFEFKSLIRFRHEIVSLEMAPDHSGTGRWTVRYRSLASETPDTVQSETFDGVAICTGHHNVRNEPTFRGQETFRGKILHTHSLKTNVGFEDKRVVIVGIGNSATDAAVELSTVTKQVYLSTRRGAWIFTRVASNGSPFDCLLQRRFLVFLSQTLPYSWVNTFIEWHLNERLDHVKYGFRPRHRALGAQPTINDALPNKIISGAVQIKGDIDHFTAEGVLFKGETTVTPCDTVILGTGYKVEIPFLSETLLPTRGNKVRLYKHMFLPQIKHPQTLAFIGLFQSLGGGLPAGELQCRWFALLNAGQRQLPSAEEMEREITVKKRQMAQRYYETERHTFQVDWLPYMDELAGQIGCAPPLWKYWLTDPRLFLHLLFGVAVPYQYRLVGPNAWSGAREAILQTNERIAKPFQTNARKRQPTKWHLNDMTCSGILFLLVGILTLAFISSLLMFLIV